MQEGNFLVILALCDTIGSFNIFFGGKHSHDPSGIKLKNNNYPICIRCHEFVALQSMLTFQNHVSLK